MYVFYRLLNGCTGFDESWYMYHLDLQKKDHGGEKPKGRFLSRVNIKIREPLETSSSAINPFNI